MKRGTGQWQFTKKHNLLHDAANLLALHSNNIYYTGVLIKSLTAAYYTVHTKHIMPVLGDTVFYGILQSGPLT